ncbi:hypothetical protein ANACOL_01943 [Anaerotruncus colihominis DSM 17241]|uniref:Uncharacterized protein n=1 Tax=Anaerotruncus colihominis DSM 17241 TaxID=445972 RepID=B0PAZ1_9FIRM|nr:hypothetical protein ANACOL_01943 [Anaerotruncus colihominis DSM 17241]
MVLQLFRPGISQISAFEMPQAIFLRHYFQKGHDITGQQHSSVAINLPFDLWKPYDIV